MKIEVHRKYVSPRSIIGEIWIDGQEECFCLEPAETNPVNPGHPCVAAGGPYDVALTFSPHLGYVCPEVLNVPERSEIRHHKGNRPEDTLGCTLYGTSIGPAQDWINASKEAFDKAMVLYKTAIDAGEKITVEYFSVGS